MLFTKSPAMQFLKASMNDQLKKAVVFCALFFISIVSYGQFVEARLIFKDNSQQEGYVHLRSLGNKNKNDGHQFKFRESTGSKKIKVASQSVRYMILKDKKGDGEHLLAFVPMKWKRAKRTVDYGPFWHKVLRGGERASLYVHASEFALYKGKIILQSHSFTYFLKKESETYGSFLDYGPHTKVDVLSQNPRFEKNAAEFFSDSPRLAARISSRELVFKDIFDIVDLYNKRTK